MITAGLKRGALRLAQRRLRAPAASFAADTSGSLANAASLKSNVKMLGSTLGNMLPPATLEQVEHIRHAGKVSARAVSWHDAHVNAVSA